MEALVVIVLVIVVLFAVVMTLWGRHNCSGNRSHKTLQKAVKKNNKPEYRLGDAFFLEGAHGDKARSDISVYHRNSLGAFYLANARYVGDFNGMNMAVEEFAKAESSTEEVIMHLRLGDAAGMIGKSNISRTSTSKVPLNPSELVEYIRTSLNSFERKNLKIISGIHRQSEQGILNGQHYVNYLKKKLKFATFIEHDEVQADTDLIRMIFAKEFIPSAGNFSLLVLLLRKYRGLSVKHRSLLRNPCVGQQLRSNVACKKTHWSKLRDMENSKSVQTPAQNSDIGS